MSNLCIHDRDLFLVVEYIAWRWACLYDLPLVSVEPYPAHASSSAYGWNDVQFGRIAICVRRSNNGLWDKAPLSTEAILDTIAHELAHFEHKGEGKKHRKFTKALYDDMIEEGMFDRIREERVFPLDRNSRRV